MEDHDLENLSEEHWSGMEDGAEIAQEIHSEITKPPAPPKESFTRADVVAALRRELESKGTERGSEHIEGVHTALTMILEGVKKADAPDVSALDLFDAVTEKVREYAKARGQA